MLLLSPHALFFLSDLSCTLDFIPPPAGSLDNEMSYSEARGAEVRRVAGQPGATNLGGNERKRSM